MNFRNNLWADILNYLFANIGFIGLVIKSFNIPNPTCRILVISMGTIFCLSSIIFSIIVLKQRHNEIKKKEDETPVFERNDFFKFIDQERRKARSSIINIVGDMSWIQKEKDKMEQLMKNSQNLSMLFFYDPTVSLINKDIIQEYKNLGAQMIPYPIQGGAEIKLMLVDILSNDGSKMYGIERFNKNKESFIVHIFNSDTYPIKIAREYTRLLTLIKKPLVIGISGINNIGKTTLATEISKLFPNDVLIINDPWSYMDKAETNKYDKDDKRKYQRNLALLCLNNQLFNYVNAITTTTKKLIILDRTPIDSCAFLDYNTKYEFSIANIKAAANGFTKGLDRIILLNPGCDYIYTDTNSLKKIDRKKIKKNISKKYEDHTNIKEYTIQYNKESYKEYILEIAKETAEYIKLNIIR